MKTNDLHWLAGYLEGEGCFSIRMGRHGRYTSPLITVSATDEDVVAHAAVLMGVKCWPVPVRRGQNKPIFRATLHGAKAVNLMQELLPLMGARRAAKIKEVIQLAASRLGVAHGERQGSAKLTDNEVRRIRREYEANPSRGRQSFLARKYGVTQANIWFILVGASRRRTAGSYIYKPKWPSNRWGSQSSR